MSLKPLSLEPTKTVAIIVGVEQYAGGPEWNLDGPIQDAGRFREWLLGSGLPPENIHQFLSDSLVPVPGPSKAVNQHQATRSVFEDFIAKKLPKLIQGNQPPDFVVLFWGGHGLMKEEERHLFFADANEGNMTSVALASLLRFFESEAMGPDPAKMKVLAIIDACADYAELKGVTNVITSIDFPKPDRVPGRKQFNLFATAEGQYAKELSARKTGLFSSYLLERLEEQRKLDRLLDIKSICGDLLKQFEQLRSEGKATQVPSYTDIRDWDSSRTRDGQPLLRTASNDFESLHVSRQELEELLRITAGATPPVPDTVTKAAFSAILPLTPTKDYSGMELFRDCLRTLQPGLSDQVFKFLELCRPSLQGGELPKRLDDLEKTIAGRLGLNLDELRRQAKEAKPMAVPVSVNRLQVIVDPVQRPGLKPAYNMWMNIVGHGVEAGRAPILAGKEAKDRNELSGQFLELFKKAFAGINTLENFRLEVVLPLELLPAGAEDWLVASGSHLKAIGKLYGVALRSYERAYYQDFRDGLLRQKLKWTQMLGGLSPENFVWLEAPPPIDTEGDVPWNDPHLIAWGTPRLGSEKSHELTDLMDAIVMSGFPLAVWLQGFGHGVSPADALNQLKQLFDGKAYEQWIDEGLKFRKEPVATRKPPGTGMSILYDDPNCPPPPAYGCREAPLKPPAYA